MVVWLFVGLIYVLNFNFFKQKEYLFQNKSRFLIL